MPEPYYQYFKLVTRMSKAIHSGNHPKEIIETIVAHATDFTGAKGSIYWLVDRSREKIHSFICHGFEYRSLSGVEYDTLIQIFNPDQEKEVYIEDARYDERIPNLERLGKKRIRSVTGINLDISGQYTGILALYFSGIKRILGEELELVHALGEQGAIALHKALSHDGHMLKILEQMVETLVLAIEARDETTHGHSIKVARLAKSVAVEMELNADEVETVFHAGLLHDIGKIGLDDDILARLGVLSKKEMHAVKQHPLVGAGIVRPLSFLKGLEPIIKYHHERYNGSGYPEGLKGENIPLGARIVGVCDAFETMISGRRHMQPLSFNDAISSMKGQTGELFDPLVVDALFRMIRKHPECIEVEGPIGQCLSRMERELEDLALAGLKNRCLDHPICF
jgi:putative nucleotidyltransferase with HDIG domain